MSRIVCGYRLVLSSVVSAKEAEVQRFPANFDRACSTNPCSFQKRKWLLFSSSYSLHFNYRNNKDKDQVSIYLLDWETETMNSDIYCNSFMILCSVPTSCSPARRHVAHRVRETSPMIWFFLMTKIDSSLEPQCFRERE